MKGERTIFRFNVGQTVWVRDYRPEGGYKLEKATVREQHEHPGRHPWYPDGEGYSLDGNLWWDCYPGCRVHATREAARDFRLPKNETEAEHFANIVRSQLGEERR